jgi:CRISPR-associated protein Csm1
VIGPWLTTIRLAADLNHAFRRFAGGNPDVTLSAGIELADPKEPLVRIVERAERRLEAAKSEGRNRVSLILPDEGTIAWPDLDWALEAGDQLNAMLRSDNVATSFVYKLLWFADRKARADGGDPEAADWLPKYRYHLARQATDRRLREDARDAFEAAFHHLLGLDAKGGRPARIPITLALYRNR